MSDTDRREFLKQVAVATGGVVLMPMVTSCASTPKPVETGTKPVAKAGTKASDPNAIPMEKTAGWDAITYNKTRGNAGAIPKTYLASINGPDGDKKHLGKHLPYVPAGIGAPAGMIAIMWGDPSKGYAKHPNAPKDDSKNYPGHWYNWIKVRKAVAGEAEELKSEYVDWPGTDEQRKKLYVVAGGGDITADKGKNTVYMVALPKDVKKGDTVRIHAHCLTHGEYVDFLTI